MHVQKGSGGRQEGIFAFFRRIAGVSGNTREGDVRFRRRQEVLRAANHLADVIGLKTDVHAEDFVNALNSAGAFHRRRTANAFFGRLEDETNLALEFIAH